MGEYNTAAMVEALRRAAARTHAPIGEYWGVLITTEACNATADRLEELQARLAEYEDTGLTPEQVKNLASDQGERLINILAETLPQLVQAIVERLPQLVEAAMDNTVEELQEGRACQE